jgi:uncharacterized protein involved in response to NO
MAVDQPKRITLIAVGKEPFRLFFPEGVLAGILGVSLWPLHFGGLTSFYPGQAHARLMAYGLFGGFIFGFLGTAMPRMLSAPSLGPGNVLLLLGLHLAMVAAFATQHIALGDGLFLALLGLFALLMFGRARHRQDTPPPGFVLVGLAFLCVAAGTLLAVLQPGYDEAGASWVNLQKLLCYQGFVLLDLRQSDFFKTSSTQESVAIMPGKPMVVVASRTTCRISSAEQPASTARRV